MKIGQFVRAKIISCCCQDEYWYASKIGEEVMVNKKWSESSWGVEEKETGFQIADCDIEVLS